MSSIASKLEDFMKPVKDFIMKYHGNPIFWLIIFIVGVLIFSSIYRSLQKEK